MPDKSSVEQPWYLTLENGMGKGWWMMDDGWRMMERWRDFPVGLHHPSPTHVRIACTKYGDVLSVIVCTKNTLVRENRSVFARTGNPWMVSFVHCTRLICMICMICTPVQILCISVNTGCRTYALCRTRLDSSTYALYSVYWQLYSVIPLLTSTNLL